MDSIKTEFSDSEVIVKEELDVDYMITKKFEVNMSAIQEVSKDDQVSEFFIPFIVKLFVYDQFFILCAVLMCFQVINASLI